MASEKRDFDDFKAFPGSVIDNVYQFPTLSKADAKNRTRIWTSYVAVVDKDEVKKTKINWSAPKYKAIIDDYFIKNEIPDDIIVMGWAESGIHNGKITKSIPTYYDDYAFKGQSNQRNPFQQALIDQRADYLKKKERGSRSKQQKTHSNDTNVNMYFPMLATDYKSSEKYIKYPIMVQPKLDGMRCITYLSKKDGGPMHVIMYTRQQKILPHMEYIKEALYPYINKLYDSADKQSIYLDGEIYKHGKRLQDITGKARRESKSEELHLDTISNITNISNITMLNEYHIYDCFYPHELDTDFDTRHKQLSVLFDAMNDQVLKFIKPVATKIANDKKEVDDIYKLFMKQGYEGAILRNIDGIYKAHKTNMNSGVRSHDLIKLKPKFTDEFKCVDFTCGEKGKDVNAIIYICENNKGIRFNITPKNMTYKERYNMYKECEKNFNKYKNKLLTVEYEALSADGIPLRAKALLFRDYE